MAYPGRGTGIFGTTAKATTAAAKAIKNNKQPQLKYHNNTKKH